MSGVTVEPGELRQVAATKNQPAADAADHGVAATASHNILAKLFASHGVVSAPSNVAIDGRAGIREAAGRAIKEACENLAAAMNVAADMYEKGDVSSAEELGKEMRS